MKDNDVLNDNEGIRGPTVHGTATSMDTKDDQTLTTAQEVIQEQAKDS